VPADSPLNRSKRPDLRIMRDALARIAKVLAPGKFVVIESSVYPGFTENEARPTLEGSGLEAGSDFGLAYSPERINYANPPPFSEISKVVGGVNMQCTNIAAQLYRLIIRAELVTVSSPSVAEAAKMVENVYRYVNIGLVNELAILFEKMEIDTFEVIRAAATKPFGFHAHFPGPGVGGHCIPKDPYYLSFIAQQWKSKLQLPSTSAKIDSRMASHVCRGIQVALRKVQKPMVQSRITVLGLAYKGETDEVRNSPALNVIKGLARTGAHIVTYDPYVSEIRIHERIYHSEGSINDAVTRSDCCVFLVDHEVFRNVDLDLLKRKTKPPPLVYDARGMFEFSELAKRDICYVGLGRPSLFPSRYSAFRVRSHSG